MLNAITETVRAFSAPGDRVLLLAPPPDADDPYLRRFRREPATGPLPGLIETAGAAARLGRTIEARIAPPCPSVELGFPIDQPAADRFDAVIAVIDPRSISWPSAIAWSDLLTQSGALAFITHSDIVEGRWTDPSRPLADTAQAAGLTVIGHIALLEVPVREGALVPPAPLSAVTPSSGGGHLRIHSDLLVFARRVQGPGPAEERR